MHNAMKNGNQQGLWLAHGLWFNFWLIILTLITGVMVVLFTFFERRASLGRRLAGLWGRLLLKVADTPVTVEGLEHLIPGQTYVFAANHRSNFDIFVLMATIPGEFLWVAKKSLFQIPILGQALVSLGSISVDRTNLRMPSGASTRPLPSSNKASP